MLLLPAVAPAGSGAPQSAVAGGTAHGGDEHDHHRRRRRRRHHHGRREASDHRLRMMVSTRKDLPCTRQQVASYPRLRTQASVYAVLRIILEQFDSHPTGQHFLHSPAVRGRMEGILAGSAAESLRRAAAPSNDEDPFAPITLPANERDGAHDAPPGFTSGIFVTRERRTPGVIFLVALTNLDAPTIFPRRLDTMRPNTCLSMSLAT